MTAWYQYPIFQGNKYATTYHGPNTDTPHYAYDIETPLHTPITAPLAGTVVKADYQGWGGEIFIQPDNHSLPEYYFYHPDLLEVSTGQHVNAGQEIALSGGENPGTPGAIHPAQNQYSSGPHTHMGWFTNWVTPPETGVTIAYGPDPGNLLQAAAGTGVINNMPTGNTTPGTSVATLGFNPFNAGDWSSLGAAIQQKSGPIFLRLGVGIVGIGLIFLGAREIIGALEEHQPLSVGGSSSSGGGRGRGRSKMKKAAPAEKKAVPAKEEKAAKEQKKQEKAAATAKKVATAEKVAAVLA